MKKPKIWFAWSCGLSKKSVEPLYEAAVAAGYDCSFECRGRYDDLVERMEPFTHYVFGVGPDVSWRHAKEAGIISINIMHGQYVFGTWRAPIPDHIIFTGDAYIKDAEKIFARKDAKYYAPGYIRADILKTYVDNPIKDIDCLVALPKVDEHPHMRTMELIESLKDLPLTYRVHPRNSKTRQAILDLGLEVDTEETFYGSLSRAKCLLSGPSNCIIEACAFGIPVGLFSTPPEFEPNIRIDRVGVMQQRYHQLLVDTYKPMATIFENEDSIRQWVANPIAKPKEAAQQYWANVDGDLQPIIDCFLSIIELCE